jgi:Mg-chelatase subunit ChlD
MRRLMVVAAVMAAFSQTSAVAHDEAPPPRPTPPEITYPRPHPHPHPHPQPRPYPQPYSDGMCRRAPALQQLGQENQGSNNQNPSRWTPRGVAPPSAMEAAKPSSRSDRDYSAGAPPPAPSASAPVMGSTTARTEESVAVTGARRSGIVSDKRAAGSASDYMPTPPRGRTQSQVQSGQLTAGEHDDLLNPALYASYVTKFLAGETLSGVPRVDTGKALSVIVQDNSGAPVPFAQVTLTCSDGNTLSLTSMADGRVVFFPDLDRLGQSVTMTASGAGNGQSQMRTINVADVRGAQEVRTRLSYRGPQVRQFDLAVVIDATGSMGDEINYLKAELASIVETLGRRHRGLDIRVAMVIYRDQGDEFVTRTFEFTHNMADVQRNLSAQSAGGGGDMPEAMEVAMTRAVGLNWRDNAVKSMLLVADAPPHSGDVAATWAATEAARAKRIQIVPVAASGVDDAAQYIMRAMAAATQSRYAFLTDDSGIGNSHAEPSVDCYHVTKLDSLVRRILDAQISGRRIEPDNSEIMRTVGNYDNGKCRT